MRNTFYDNTGWPVVNPGWIFASYAHTHLDWKLFHVVGVDGILGEYAILA